jgi:uncharacterized repeat protein (TIGR03803 family)
MSKTNCQSPKAFFRGRFGAFTLVFFSFFVSYASASPAFNQIYAFCSKHNTCNDGQTPVAGLVMDFSGNLYGTTQTGGKSNAGTVFELMHGEDGSWTEAVLHPFCSKAGCVDGAGPVAALIFDQSGNLYGTTSGGGKYGSGVAFELSPNADRSKWTIHVLHAFCSTCKDGVYIYAGLSYAGQSSGAPYDGASALFGTAFSGGAYGRGIVYELAPAKSGKWHEKILYSFCANGCSDGQNPAAEVLVADPRTLYGTTEFGGGGANGDGEVFKLVRPRGQKNWQQSVLYSFCTQANCADGDTPLSRLFMDSKGNLLGTTPYGGAAGSGVVFRVAPDGGETVLYSFCSQQNCADGGIPQAGIVEDQSGNIFGTTYAWGKSEEAGVVFELNASYQVLYPFCSQNGCLDGSSPWAQVIVDSAGNLFGTTSAGGPGWAGGTVFELTPHSLSSSRRDQMAR